MPQKEGWFGARRLSSLEDISEEFVCGAQYLEK
jgi:hypothetical protein